jgi:hypothetical protein
VVGLSGGPTRWGCRLPASRVPAPVLTEPIQGSIYESEATTRTERAQSPATGPRALRTGGLIFGSYSGRAGCSAQRSKDPHSWGLMLRVKLGACSSVSHYRSSGQNPSSKRLPPQPSQWAQSSSIVIILGDKPIILPTRIPCQSVNLDLQWINCSPIRSSKK